MEARFFEPGQFPFTPEWYETREHAPHAEQAIHHARMHTVALWANDLIHQWGLRTVVDLGAGDGGLLQMISNPFQEAPLRKWGYDLQQNNVDYARNVRHQDVRYADFTDEPIQWGQLAIITECLEHLEHPHDMVRRINDQCDFILASSPMSETEESHDGCHAWAWDQEGYANLLEKGGFQVVKHAGIVGDYDFQVILGAR